MSQITGPFDDEGGKESARFGAAREAADSTRGRTPKEQEQRAPQQLSTEQARATIERVRDRMRQIHNRISGRANVPGYTSDALVDRLVRGIEHPREFDIPPIKRSGMPAGDATLGRLPTMPGDPITAPLPFAPGGSQAVPAVPVAPVVGGQPLPRSVGDALVGARVVFSEAAADSALLANRFGQLLLQQLPYYESLPGWTHENRADLVLTPFTQRPPSRNTPRLKFLIGSIRGHMDLQPEPLRQDGYYQTVAGLADVLMMPRDGRGIREAVFLYRDVASHYHRVVSKASEHPAASESPTGPKLSESARTRVRNCVFNTVLAVLDELQLEAPQFQAEKLEPFARIAVVMQTSVSEDMPSAVPKGLERFAGPDSQIQPTDVAVLSLVGRLPGVWRGLESKHHAMLATAAACAALDKGPGLDSVTLIFNAAVDFLRAARQAREGRRPDLAKFDEQDGIRARALLAGLGLVVSLTDARSFRAGLVERQGISCAVNFLGAASDIKLQQSDDPEGRFAPAVRTVAGCLLATRPEIGLGNEPAFGRVDAALADLNLRDLAGDPSATPERMRTAAIDVLNVILALAKEPPIGASGTPPEALDSQIGRAARASFRLVLAENLDSTWKAVWDRIRQLASESKDPESVFRTEYAPFATSSWGEAGTPLDLGVQSMRTTPEQWEQIAQSMVLPTPSLAEAVARVSPPDWW